jgi:hypothetical protein
MKINPVIIPAVTPGQHWGNNYQFLDVTAEISRAYFYWVGGGKTQRFGPVKTMLVLNHNWLPLGLR